MTPADDLPPLPEPFMRLMSQPVYDAWAAQMRAYALAARAERDAEIERLRAALSAAQRLQAAYKVAADVGDYPEQIAQRDAEIERLKAKYAASFDEAVKMNEAIIERDEMIRELEIKLADLEGRQWEETVKAINRAEAAEARMKELERVNQILSASDPYLTQVGIQAARAETAEARVAELEERLMVMCVAQLKAAEPAESATLNDPNWQEFCQQHPQSALAAIYRSTALYRWLHNNSYKDAEGFEYGITKVRFNPDGSPGCVLWTLGDGSEEDAAMKAAQEFVPSPDPPAPASLAAQGVEGEPHHER